MRILIVSLLLSLPSISRAQLNTNINHDEEIDRHKVPVGVTHLKDEEDEDKAKEEDAEHKAAKPMGAWPKLGGGSSSGFNNPGSVNGVVPKHSSKTGSASSPNGAGGTNGSHNTAGGEGGTGAYEGGGGSVAHSSHAGDAAAEQAREAAADRAAQDAANQQREQQAAQDAQTIIGNRGAH